MPAPGFRRVPATALPEAHSGRVWRVSLRDGNAVSLGNKGVENITVTDTGVVVRERNGGVAYPMDAVESVLVEEELPKQRTLTAWSGPG